MWLSHINFVCRACKLFFPALTLLISQHWRIDVQKNPSWKFIIELISNNFEAIIAILLILMLTVAIAEFCTEKSIKKMKNELDEATCQLELIGGNVKDLFNGYLTQLSHKFGFGSQHENTERITLYIHDKDRNHFIPCGRYSANPAYCKPGRPEYPDNEGCIAEGWRNGWYFGSNKPFGISKKVLTKRNMQSEQFAVWRIDAPNRDFLAVLVVESTNKDRFVENDLKEKINEDKVYIAELITKLKNYIPNLGNATSRGY